MSNNVGKGLFILFVLFCSAGVGMALAADVVRDIDLSQQQTYEMGVTHNPMRDDTTPLDPADVIETQYFCCLDCAAPNDAGDEDKNLYIPVGQSSDPDVPDGAGGMKSHPFTYDLSAFGDGDVVTCRAKTLADDKIGGTGLSLLSSDRLFLVLTVPPIPEATPNAPANIR